MLTLFSLTYSAIVASGVSDPTVYDSTLQFSRAAFELIGFGSSGVITVLLELNQFRKYYFLFACGSESIFAMTGVKSATVVSCRQRAQYWKDAFNCLDLASSVLLVLVIPFRFLHKQWQWFCFSLGYLLWTLRIFKYAAVFR